MEFADQRRVWEQERLLQKHAGGFAFCVLDPWARRCAEAGLVTQRLAMRLLHCKWPSANPVGQEIVYLATNSSRVLKVGLSKKPVERINALRAKGYPGRFQLIGIMKGGRREHEATLCQLLSEFVIQGEEYFAGPQIEVLAEEIAKAWVFKPQEPLPAFPSAESETGTAA